MIFYKVGLFMPPKIDVFLLGLEIALNAPTLHWDFVKHLFMMNATAPVSLTLIELKALIDSLYFKHLSNC